MSNKELSPNAKPSGDPTKLCQHNRKPIGDRADRSKSVGSKNKKKGPHSIGLQVFFLLSESFVDEGVAILLHAASNRGDSSFSRLDESETFLSLSL